jgi:hypothetical protein
MSRSSFLHPRFIEAGIAQFGEALFSTIGNSTIILKRIYIPPDFEIPFTLTFHFWLVKPF